MKCIIILLFIGSACFGQAKDTAKVKLVNEITDSTGLLGIRDIQSLSKFLEDKMIAKDYNLVMNAISQLIEARAKEYATKQKHK